MKRKNEIKRAVSFCHNYTKLLCVSKFYHHSSRFLLSRSASQVSLSLSLSPSGHLRALQVGLFCCRAPKSTTSPNGAPSSLLLGARCGPSLELGAGSLCLITCSL